MLVSDEGTFRYAQFRGEAFLILITTRAEAKQCDVANKLPSDGDRNPSAKKGKKMCLN